MVWFRLLLALLVVALAIGGIWYVQRHSRASDQARRERLALLSARIWVATAEYRDRPDTFLAWRDSLLAGQNLSAASLRAMIDRYRDDPIEYEEYTRLVSYYVDSLVQDYAKPPDRYFDPTDTLSDRPDTPTVRVRRE